MPTPDCVEPIRFDCFELKPDTGELLKLGIPVKLQPQPFRLLHILVSRPGELVTREEIRQAIWADGTTVEFDQNLNYCIRQIRAALGENAQDPSFIETLPKRGYRFIAPLTSPPQQEKSPPSPSPKPQSSSRLPLITIAATLLLALLLFVNWSAKQLAPRKEILISPFVNLDLPQQDAWFANAITQQLIASMAETKSVHVPPWTSSMAARDKRMSISEMGKYFHVDAVLEGSVSRSGDRLRVATRLIDVASNQTLWSHQDERGSPDLSQISTDVMHAIAGTLKLRLNEPSTNPARRPPQDLETYNLYLRAVALGDQFTAKGTAASIRDFEEVIRRAPGYAPAYAGLANSLTLLIFGKPASAESTLPKAKEAAQRALALDPGLSMAHAALAHAHFLSWDWPAAEKEFKTALVLDPDSAMAHQLYGLFLATQARSQEALREGKRAMELAPTSGLVSYSFTNILLHSGKLDEATAQARITMEIDKGFRSAHGQIARAFALKGMYAESFQALQDWDSEGPNPSSPLWRAAILAKSGQQPEARKLLDRWLEENPRAANPPLPLAVTFLAIGEKDRAFEAMRKGIEQHVGSYVWLKSTPEFAPLHTDPRFQSLITLMTPINPTASRM